MSNLIKSLEELFTNIELWFSEIFGIIKELPINSNIAIDETIKAFLSSGSIFLFVVGLLAWLKKKF